MKNVAYRFLGNLVILVQNKDSPSEDEVLKMLDDLKGQDLTRLRILVHTQGGGPSLAQRKILNEALAGCSLRMAVISDAKMVRGITTALSWFNPDIKLFSTQQLPDALKYLAVPPEELNTIRRELELLQKELNAPAMSSVLAG
jgi:hypothetical protein